MFSPFGAHEPAACGPRWRGTVRALLRVDARIDSHPVDNSIADHGEHKAGRERDRFILNAESVGVPLTDSSRLVHECAPWHRPTGRRLRLTGRPNARRLGRQ
jgi:hypothetical protein